MSSSVAVGSVVAVWRYPVKSMMGEELNGVDVTERGVLGDRAYALVDQSDGKVVSAKNPRKWPQLFDLRATYSQPPRLGQVLPEARIELSNGTILMSGHTNTNHLLSRHIGRRVRLETIVPDDVQLEEYWPNLEKLEHRDTVTEEAMRAGTFFDGAPLHLLTTSTLATLRTACPQGRFETRRFRPNFVIQTSQPGFFENEWVGRTVLLGEQVRIRVARRCPRCVMTTLSQSDLPQDSDILRTVLAKNEGCVGVYAEVLQAGRVQRGDSLTLEE